MRIRTLALTLIIAHSLLSFSTLRPPEARGAAAQSSATGLGPAPVPAPEEVLGFRPGDDRKLAGWSQVVDYFRKLDAASDRVRFEELGKTTMGAPFVMATISSPENLARLEEYKKIQEQLADPRLLGPDPDRKAAGLIARGKTIVLITCGIHSDEVGSYLSSMLIAHRLASGEDPAVREILQNTIVLLVPSLNPDGVDIVKNWYDKTLGTPYEGTDPPELYHKYTGHDDNRDWYAFTQVETQITVERIHDVWHPQIVHDIHQQGETGARLFLPPYMQPVEPNVPRQIVEGYTELGLAMKDELRSAGFKGITWDSTYDAWTPARAYSHYHGGVRILSETASAKIATPVRLRFEDLRAGLGYDPRQASANFPDVWQGGQWRLRDITDYMTAAAFALLRNAARERERWLKRFYEIGKEAVRPRGDGELYAFVIPPDDEKTAASYMASQPRRRLLSILSFGGVELERAHRFTAAGVTYPEDTIVVRLAQPYGGFAKALLEAQRYPDLRDKAGHPIPPYDVTAHTLPLLLGVKVVPVYRSFKYGVINSDQGWGGGHGVFDPRYAIYKSYVPAIDEGWTRWVIEQEPEFGRRCCPSLMDAEARAGNLYSKYNTIVIPDQAPRAILEGYKRGTMPPELTGGLGAEGVKALREFVTDGGTLICLNRASGFAIEQLGLPVRDVVAGLPRTEYYAPGSILRVELDKTHPLTGPMPAESIAWAENSPVFELSDARQAANVKVIARYPSKGKVLLSGWLLGEEKLRGRAALVEVTLGKGRVYLFGFRPQYRGQSMATYPLFLGAIFSGGMY
jgi:hypothetical protein